MNKNGVNNLRALAMSAVLSALSFVLMLLDFPLPFIIPNFIKFDFSELPALIGAFAFGPLWGVFICLIKNLLHLFVTTTAGVGELSNFLLGAVFTGVCGIVYRYHRTRKGAFLSALIGAVAMAVVSIPINYFVVYPFYVKFYGMPMEAIIGMYKAILPAADTLLKDLLIFNLPFNIVKGLADTAICFMVYKRISPILKYGKMSKPS